LGRDIDALLGLSQYPGVADKKPMVESTIPFSLPLIRHRSSSTSG
jgi:hypothetical protein